MLLIPTRCRDPRGGSPRLAVASLSCWSLLTVGGIIVHLRYRIARSLAVICCLAFVVAPALAAKPVPTDVKQFTLQLPAAPAATCQLGVLGPPFNAFGYVLPPDDAYYTLLDPASDACAARSPLGLVRATLGHISLF